MTRLQVFSSLLRVRGGGQMQTYLPSAFWLNVKVYGPLYCTPEVLVDVEPLVVVEPPVVVVEPPVVLAPPVEVLVVPLVLVAGFHGSVVNPVTSVLLSPQNFTSTNEQWHSLHRPSIHWNPSGHFAQFPWFMKYGCGHVQLAPSQISGLRHKHWFFAVSQYLGAGHGVQ